MSTNKILNDNKKAKNDEFYTHANLVKDIMDGSRKVLEGKGKKIKYIFPADGDQSEFTKYGKANHLDFVNLQKFEDFPKYIKDEPNTQYMVVTNPPFSKMNNFLNPKLYPDIDKALHNPNVHHGFINGQTNMNSDYTMPYAKKDHVYAIKGDRAWYNQPNGKPPKKLDNTVYFSDLDINWPNKDTHYQGKRPTKAIKNPDNSYLTPPNWIRYKEHMSSHGYDLTSKVRPKGKDAKTGKETFMRLLWTPNYNHPNYNPHEDLTKPDLEIVPHPKKKNSNYVVSLDDDN